MKDRKQCGVGSWKQGVGESHVKAFKFNVRSLCFSLGEIKAFEGF